MKSVGPATVARAAIVSRYQKATYCYVVPLVLLVLGFVVPYIGVLWLLTLCPFGIAGLFFTQRGLALAAKWDDREKKSVGYANLVLGVSMLVFGLLAWAFVYVR